MFLYNWRERLSAFQKMHIQSDTTKSYYELLTRIVDTFAEIVDDVSAAAEEIGEFMAEGTTLEEIAKKAAE